jgi:hydroxyacyl-ACP dehydratase HTD2-like protein with hotdog domain
MEQGKICWENVSVSSQIPELTVRPDHMQVFMFSAVTWNRHHIHYSKDAALGEGLPDVVVQRGLIGNFLARLITNWVGASAELRKLTWKVTRSAQPGKEIVCRGKVKEKTESQDQRCLICEVTASSESEELIASGSATVLFATDHERG